MTISNCGHDENGKYSGGKAGDQSGTEWYLRGWYNAGWQAMYRHPDANVRAKISEFAVSAAKNDHIGYDQSQRETFWRELEKAGYDPARIATDCETDCSAGVAAIVKAVGYVLGIDNLKNVSIAMYTGNQDAVLVSAGFQRYTDGRYLTSDANLAAGDILRSSGHTTINVTGEASGIMSGGLASTANPCKGWTGDLVKKVQSALISKGYSCGASGVDGSFGVGTDAAVRAYQRDHGLEVDGIAGPKTQASLFGASAGAVADKYPAGTYVTCVGCLNVRTGAGTNYATKTKGQLTADGQRHSNANGQLNSGTTVTVTQVKQVGGDWWGLIPSGWICLEYQGKVYANRK